MVADRTSSGFGGKLRDARERRGISLRQIANATKISIAALEALERNDVSRLPGEINGHTNGTSGQPKLPVMAALPSRGNQALPSLEITALDPGTPVNDVTIEIRPADEGAPDDQRARPVVMGAGLAVVPGKDLPQDIAGGASSLVGQDIIGGASIVFKRPPRVRGTAFRS